MVRVAVYTRSGTIAPSVSVLSRTTSTAVPVPETVRTAVVPPMHVSAQWSRFVSPTVLVSSIVPGTLSPVPGAISRFWLVGAVAVGSVLSTTTDTGGVLPAFPNGPWNRTAILYVPSGRTRRRRPSRPSRC